MKKQSRIFNFILTLSMIIVVLIAIALVGVRLIGLTPYAVLSGSMEPGYHVGSLIYDEDVTQSDLKVGDVITFTVAENTVATHRIVEIVPDIEDTELLFFRTKGDANDYADAELVDPRNIKGRAVFNIPLLGYVSNFVTTFPGKYISMAFMVIIIAMAIWPEDDEKIKGGKNDN